MRTFFAKAVGAVLMIHPFPVMMVVTLATVLALATAREATDLSRLARAIATLFFSQVVVGMSNDYHDRLLDAEGQPWKPLARGIVTPNEARVLIGLAFVLMLGFSVSLGPLVVLFALLGTFAGILYNFWLRDTAWSWFPYVFGFIVLPISVWVSIERFDIRQLLLVPIGLPLLVGVHLAQTLPDTETDLALGVGGFAVTLGRGRGVLAVWSTLIGGQLIAAFSAWALESNVQIVFLGVGASFVLVAASIGLYHARPSSATLRAIFRLVAASAVILVGGWLAALRM